MEPMNFVKSRSDTQPQQLRTARTVQVDSFEVLIAASQTEDPCTSWIVERISDREAVSL